MKEVNEKVEMREASLYSQESKGESVFFEWVAYAPSIDNGWSELPSDPKKEASSQDRRTKGFKPSEQPVWIERAKEVH